MGSEASILRLKPKCHKCGSGATRFWDEICKEFGYDKEEPDNRFFLYCQNCGCSSKISENREENCLEETCLEERRENHSVRREVKEEAMVRGKVTCPKCGASAVCFWEEIGAGNQFVDEYTLICELCGYKKSERKDGGVKDSQSEEVTFCPFCHTECYDHLAKIDYLARERGFRKRCQNCGRGGAKDFAYCPWCGIPYEPPSAGYEIGGDGE